MAFVQHLPLGFLGFSEFELPTIGLLLFPSPLCGSGCEKYILRLPDYVLSTFRLQAFQGLIAAPFIPLSPVGAEALRHDNDNEHLFSISVMHLPTCQPIVWIQLACHCFDLFSFFIRSLSLLLPSCPFCLASCLSYAARPAS